MRNLITDGETCRLRIIVNQCDDFRDQTAPEGMARLQREIQTELVAMLRRRLIDDFQIDETGVREAVTSLQSRGTIVFPCSVLGYDRVHTPPEQRSSRVSTWLRYNELDNEDQTGVPALVVEIQNRIENASDFLSAVIAQYAQFIQMLESAAEGTEGLVDSNALQLMDDFAQITLQQRVRHQSSHDSHNTLLFHQLT